MTFEYELVLITSTDEKKAKEALEGVKKLIENVKGKIVKETNMGQKILAYAINKENEGIYYSLDLKMEPSQLNGLSGKLRNTPSVIRHLLLRSEKGKTKEGKKGIKDKEEEKVKKVSLGKG